MESLTRELIPWIIKTVLFLVAARILYALLKEHLYALMNADVNAYVDLPPECLKKGVCGRLNYWLYGMRPASKGWEIEYTKRLKTIGF